MNKLYEFKPEIKRLLVVGDLHGDLEAFNRAVSLWKEMHDSHILFLGDYADRGNSGVEILEALMGLSKDEKVVCLKGNHEDYSKTGIAYWAPCSLPEEVEEKRGDWKTYFDEKLQPFFDSLYLAAIIPNQILFVHGGISSKITNLDGLRFPDRRLEKEILWSDPSAIKGEIKNRQRGIGEEFGEDITDLVMERLNVKLIVRSHQPQLARKAPYYSHNGKILTISSTNAYDRANTSPRKPYFLEINLAKESLIISRVV